MRCHSVACGTHTRAVDPISECTFLLMPVKVCTGARAHPRMILRAILALFPLAICILVVVLAYQKTRDR
jgi:hypothetical protein